MEAWRRQLDDPVRAFPVDRAGPAHVATLKTFDPPLSELEGRRFGGAERRGKRLLFPTEEGDLTLVVHLMSAGRLRYLRPDEKRPKTPAFSLRFTDGAELVLTEAGKKKRAGVWLFRPEVLEEELAHLGPEALGLGEEQLAEILRASSHRLHPLLRDQREIAGIGRAWANEILRTAHLSPYALSTQLSDEEIARLSAAIDSELERGLALRLEGQTTSTRIASTTASASRAPSVRPRSRRSTSRSTRSTTARIARPAAACSRTAGSPAF